jgi:hypothetical protein
MLRGKAPCNMAVTASPYALPDLHSRGVPMSLLRDTNGLVVLLSSAVLFGLLVLGALRLWRFAPKRAQVTGAAKAVSEAAAKAPTDAHMSLIVAGKMLRQLVSRE